jgi:sarcosine oxidase subunit gamma
MLTLGEATIAAAWNVQGDVQRMQLPLPTVPNTVARDGPTTIFWLGPRSWLVFAERVDASGGAAFDVSASRVAWTLRGEDADVVLNGHCPLDLDARAFAPGTCAQSLFGPVNALYYRHARGGAFTLFVARSFAHDVLHHLRESAARYGCETIASRAFVAD